MVFFINRYRYLYLFIFVFCSLNNALVAYAIETPMGKVSDSYQVIKKHANPEEAFDVSLDSNADDDSLSITLTSSDPISSYSAPVHGSLSQAQLMQLNDGLSAYPPQNSVSPQMVMMALATLPLASSVNASHWHPFPLLNENTQLTCTMTDAWGSTINIHGDVLGSEAADSTMKMKVIYNKKNNCIEVSYGYSVDGPVNALMIHQNLVFIIPLSNTDMKSVVKSEITIDDYDDFSGCCCLYAACLTLYRGCRSCTRKGSNEEPVNERSNLLGNNLLNEVVFRNACLLDNKNCSLFLPSLKASFSIE